MNALADSCLYRFRLLPCESVDTHATRVIFLQVGPIDGPTRSRLHVAMLYISDDAHNGSVELDIVASTFGDQASNRILRRAVEPLGKGEIDHRHLLAALGICVGKFAAYEERLLQRSEKRRQNPWGLKRHVFVFRSNMTLHCVVGLG